MDKVVVQILVFDGEGWLCGVVLGLFGLVIGDYIVFGVVGLVLCEILGWDCIMLVGCFVGGYGLLIDVGCVLWVDYEFVVFIYFIVIGVLVEKWVECFVFVLLDDNCVMYGCINVLFGFYEQIISIMFQWGGVFYIFLDVDLIEKIFFVFVKSCVVLQDEDGKCMCFVCR